jgi:hypothetical protein
MELPAQDDLPDDIDALKAALSTTRIEFATARAQVSNDQALIAHLQLLIAKLNRDRFGPRTERTRRLLDQLELQLDELESAATEDELAAEQAAAKTTQVSGFTRQRPARKPFPEHLPRERIVEPAPTTCSCCGGDRLRKLGEDITETRIDALFAIERTINGQTAEQRRAVRRELSAPLVADLERWMREQRAKLSRGNDFAKAMDYMLKRGPAFTRFLEDGRVCLSNNAAERALRGIALGRKSRLFAGSDRGGQRAAAMYSLIITAKMNDVDPQAWLADILARIAAHPARRLDKLLPWNWRARNQAAGQAA